MHDGKAAQGTSKLISLLNNYPNVVFLWGHNHSSNNEYYDKIHKSINGTNINFTYCAAGCMSDSEYVGSANVKGKGLVAKITDKKLVSLIYYDINYAPLNAPSDPANPSVDPGTKVFEKTNDVKAGGEYLIVANSTSGNSYALTNNSSNLKTQVTVNGNRITVSNSVAATITWKAEAATGNAANGGALTFGNNSKRIARVTQSNNVELGSGSTSYYGMNLKGDTIANLGSSNRDWYLGYGEPSGGGSYTFRFAEQATNNISFYAPVNASANPGDPVVPATGLESGKQYLIIADDNYALITSAGESFSNNGNGSEVYNYEGLSGTPYTQGMNITSDMLWTFTKNGSGYDISNGGKYLNGSYQSNSTGGYDGKLTLKNSNDDLWTLEGGNKLKSRNASQSDRGDKYLSHGNSGGTFHNTFTVRSNDYSSALRFLEVDSGNVNDPKTYSVTVLNDGNGTGSANVSTAVPGTVITLTAAPKSGFTFSEWQVVSGGVAVSDNRFTMPAANVVVRAVFKADNVVGIKLNRSSMTLTEGESETLVATITPDNAPNKAVTWSCTPSSVATVDNNGKVTAVNAGTALVTATMVDGGKSASCAVTVNAESAVKGNISLNKSNITLTEGESEMLIATITPEDVPNKTVTWSCAPSSVATVDENGRVTAVASGAALVTATMVDGGSSVSCVVNVEAQSTFSGTISLNKSSLTLTEGASETLAVTITPDDTPNKAVTWASTPSSVATVDDDGNVTAVKAGTALVTATMVDGGKSASCVVTVNAPDTTEYAIIVQNGKATNGEGALVEKGLAGTEITITADEAPAGKEFDKWVVSAGILADENAATTTLTMPNSNAVIMATYKDAAPDIVRTSARIAGDNRIDTAIEISKKGWSSSDEVVIACGSNYPDALAGASLAKKLDAPILLSENDKINEAVLSEIKRLRAKRITILGGTAAISQGIEDELKKLLDVERISGDNRNGTAAAIAAKLCDESDIAFLVSNKNYADALSISSVAALKNAPILYANPDGSIPAETMDALKRLGCATVYIIGGTQAIGAAAEKALNIPSERVFGADRYLTSVEVGKRFNDVFPSSDIAIATGKNYPDALAGAAFAAKNGMPVFLVDEKMPADAADYLSALNSGSIIVFGGKNAVSDAIVDGFIK